MKYAKKLASLLLAMLMAFAMATTAFATNTNAHTITITNEKSGHTYTAYQVFAGDISDGKLTNIVWGSGVNGDDLLTALKALESSPYASCEDAEDVADVLARFVDNSEQLDAFAKVAGEHLLAAAGTSAEDASPYTISVKGDGYYLVKDTGTIGSNDAATKYILKVVGDVKVKAKADAPTLEKNIVEGEKRVDANNASIGDTVMFELTSKVPEMDGYEKYFYVVHDTLSAGLEFNKDSVEVKIGSTTLEASQYDVITENLTDGCTFEIVLKDFIGYKAQAGEVITITYTATVGKAAVIGNTGNPNEAHLQYSNNPNVTPSGDSSNPDKPGPGDADLIGETTKDTTLTYVSGIELIKVDENRNRLMGAEFTITGEKINKVKTIREVFAGSADGTYYKLKNGTYTETVSTDETKDQYADTNTTYVKTEEVVWNTDTENVSAKAVVGDDGVLRFDGLAEGTYIITELKAPDGYNMLKNPITVVITCEEPETVSTVNDTAVWKYSLSGAVTASETVAADGRVQITVENKSGATLPSTGGMGTTLLYVIGSVLVVGAAVLLIVKKRMGAEK